MCKKIVGGGINGLSINKDFEEKKFQNSKISKSNMGQVWNQEKKNQNDVQKVSKMKKNMQVKNLPALPSIHTYYH